MKHRKKIERRTFIEDRFEILIKKQKNGQATFSELTELDEIVNRNAAIREKILEEMQGFNSGEDNALSKEVSFEINKQQDNLLTIIKSFLGRLFTVKSYSGISFLPERIIRCKLRLLF